MGTFNLFLNVPVSCSQVISYEKGFRESEVIVGGQTLHRYSFPKSEAQIPLPSYLIFFYAGNWNAHAYSDEHGVEYCNYIIDKSVPEITRFNKFSTLNLTPLSLATIESLMGGKQYHFDKNYCHVYTPTNPHPSVALENPSKVRMDDYFLTADFSPYLRLKGLFILAHEMGHMWWGDLIRTEWWGSVWIKEGMAEIMGMFVLDAWEKEEYPGQARGFYSRVFWERRKYDGFSFDNIAKMDPSYEGINKKATKIHEGCMCYQDDTYGKSFGVILEFFDLIGSQVLGHRDECIKQFWSESAELYAGKSMNPTEFLELSQTISHFEPEKVAKIFNQFFNTPDYIKFSIRLDHDTNMLKVRAKLPPGSEQSFQKFKIVFLDTGEKLEIDSQDFDPESQSKFYLLKNPDSKIFLADFESRCFATFDQDYNPLLCYLMEDISSSKNQWASCEIELMKLKALFNCLSSSKGLRHPNTNLSETIFAAYIRHLLNL